MALQPEVLLKVRPEHPVPKLTCIPGVLVQELPPLQDPVPQLPEPAVRRRLVLTMPAMDMVAVATER